MSDFTKGLPRTADDTEHAGTQPECRVMMAVILNAINDACGRDSVANSREQSRIDALRWFQEGGADFQLVCHLAGFDPAKVRAAALDRIATNSGSIYAQPFGVSLRAVANASGMSPATVSRVLHNKGCVQPDSETRIRAALHELTQREAA